MIGNELKRNDIDVKLISIKNILPKIMNGNLKGKKWLIASFNGENVWIVFKAHDYLNKEYTFQMISRNNYHSIRYLYTHPEYTKKILTNKIISFIHDLITFEIKFIIKRENDWFLTKISIQCDKIYHLKVKKKFKEVDKSKLEPDIIDLIKRGIERDIYNDDYDERTKFVDQEFEKYEENLSAYIKNLKETSYKKEE